MHSNAAVDEEAKVAKKRIIYGNANYADLVQKQGYFVDKTPYIAQLELVENPVYLRPRRFGKSMFCSLLHYYYDRNAAEQFDELFGQTWIGQHPTGLQNQYMVLPLNFSSIEVGANLPQLEENFRNQCNARLRWLVRSHAALFADLVELEPKGSVSNNLQQILDVIQSEGLPPLFVIIDEYDNFANHLITTNRDRFYYDLTADDSFFKTFFKMLPDSEIDAYRNQEILLKALLIGVGILLFFVLCLIIYIVCTDSNNRVRFCCRRWFLASIRCINNKKNNDDDDDESNYVEMVSIS